jgi:hypothetical protein
VFREWVEVALFLGICFLRGALEGAVEGIGDGEKGGCELLGICFWRKVREERVWAEYMGEKGGYKGRQRGLGAWPKPIDSRMQQLAQEGNPTPALPTSAHRVSLP